MIFRIIIFLTKDEEKTEAIPPTKRKKRATFRSLRLSNLMTEKRIAHDQKR